MKTQAARYLALLVFLLAAALPAAAEEFISSYHSVVDVAKSGQLTVTETITARAEGNRIKRGIFRDFPLYALDANGNRTKVGFDVLSVERDGSKEDWRTESIDGGIRIYTGNADRFLSTGDHIFQITYTTDRQIRYFNGYDELTWNVTGNGWQFPMREISATVSLPQGVAPTDTAVFTGRLGAKGKDARALTEGNEVFFASTRPFYQGEGMTIAVKLPKGAIDQPSAAQERSWWLQDHLGSVLGVSGFILILIYYYRAWSAVGRDPAKGIIIPRWDAPEGLSPALVNYVDNNGFSDDGWTAFSAASLSLAVKGYVVLDDLKSSLVIRRTEKPVEGKLPLGEAAIINTVDEPGMSFEINKKNGSRVVSLGNAFRKAIESEHSGKYYRANFGFIALGFILSIVVVLAVAVFGNFEPDAYIAMFVIGILTFVGTIFASVFGKSFTRGGSLLKRIGMIIVLALVGSMLISGIGGAITVISLEKLEALQLPAIMSVAGIIATNLIFFMLMGAPTPLGRKLMDGIEGLRLYLTVAEQDRMNMQGAPKMSPKHFETLLPYAVALGVEKPWSQAFETWLANAQAGEYSPGWYSGNYNNFSGRIGGFSTSMASTIASTIPAPVSSSSSSFSGGGGSSGSGGGGGGGGGW
ncbi:MULTISPECIES: DUF2207 domain-containing protein [unclassified Rhizobium]|uniref:DUF2207 domain-containing protein n=1 Tax=unclassified Rhizobium TaxID=2613769 RepID=UPI0017846019|nr:MULTISPECIES: DUF2207 domain-containing protein [unclassified Rhizobium]MBD8685779.1 DUF2207 domain-containing protein [Rhizobium sp. CFBP 13644]MBD8690548.1 DUF2207 domain-containing protein [Rhizobium sp. CFBP 13717]